MKRIVWVGVAALAAVVLAGCSSGGASSSSASSGSESSSSSSSSSVEVVGGEDVVSIALDYNAGTGYEWACSVEPDGVVSLVGDRTEDMAAGQNLDGGPLRDTYTFRASAPGEAVITFDLVRGWETDEEPAETQVYAFTVDDDLKMVLNPYKSSFDNEPEWGSNS